MHPINNKFLIDELTKNEGDKFLIDTIKSWIEETNFGLEIIYPHLFANIRCLEASSDSGILTNHEG